MGFDVSVWEFFQTNWGWALGLAGAMAAATVSAGRVLAPNVRESLALWLMGAETEATWATRFTGLFDAIFGARHLTLRCFVRSAIASVLAVILIWGIMAWAGSYGLRLGSDPDLLEILGYALIVNILADYVSLLETRWLLSWLAKPRPVLVHLAVLILDFALSAAIIWLALWAFLSSPFYPGEAHTFAEVAGVFSPFSVLFYSTFLTSIWSWAFILSSWVLRLFTSLGLYRFFDVEGKPIAILSLVLGGVTFLGALGSSAALSKDAAGLTAIDRGLCSVFKGEVCQDVARVSGDNVARLEMIVFACDGNVVQACLAERLAAIGVSETEARTLFSESCDAGNPNGCTSLGFLFSEGLGVPEDQTMARHLYALGCEGGDTRGCTNLGNLYRQGLGGPEDLTEARRLYAQGCEGGHALGCTNLGLLHERSLGGPEDMTEARRLYAQGCGGGNAAGCSYLGDLYERGLIGPEDLTEARRLYTLGCKGGHDWGCDRLEALPDQ